MALTAIIKPTHECNLSCKYCYVDKNAEQGRMDYKIMTLTMESAIKASLDRRTNFIWHGGEPLLMGLDFYKEAAGVSRYFRKKGYSVQNSMQSNATLISEGLLDFIEEERDFHIGSSLDGPKEINDRTRVYEGGKGAFDDIFKGLRMIRDRNRQNCSKSNRFYLGGGVIVVLNKKNIDDIEKVYEFFREQKISIKINPIINCGAVPSNYEDLQISPIKYARAMLSLFEKWIQDYDSIDIDPFNVVMGNLATNSPMGCNYSITCRKKFISIGPEGDIYPCGRFDGDKNFWMGNISEENGLEKALQSSIQYKLSQRTTENISGCMSCGYKKICNGGCMHNALLRGDIMGRDMYCSAYKLMFSHIEKFLHQELAKAELQGIERGKLEQICI